jgi:hypothetical protein
VALGFAGNELNLPKTRKYRPDMGFVRFRNVVILVTYWAGVGADNSKAVTKVLGDLWHYPAVAGAPTDAGSSGKGLHSEAFNLVYRHEANGANAIWQAEHSAIRSSTCPCSGGKPESNGSQSSLVITAAVARLLSILQIRREPIEVPRGKLSDRHGPPSCYLLEIVS